MNKVVSDKKVILGVIILAISVILRVILSILRDQMVIQYGEYSVRIMQLFRTFSAGHPEIRCSDSGCQCSPL